MPISDLREIDPSTSLHRLIAKAAGPSDPAGDGAISTDLLSKRASAVARSAEVHARTVDLRLEEHLWYRSVRSGAAAALVAAGFILACAAALGLLDHIDFHITFVLCAGLLGVALVLVVVDQDAGSAQRSRPLSFASQIAAAWLVARAARRVDRALATSRRDEPAAESRLMMAVMVRALEEECAAFARWTKEDNGSAAANARRHERIVPRHNRTTVHVADGRKLAARIIDLSLSGVAIETELTGVEIGAVVEVGTRRARAVRKLSRGMAFEFETPLPLAGFDTEIVL